MQLLCQPDRRVCYGSAGEHEHISSRSLRASGMGGRRTLASDRDAFSGARGRSEAFARESHARMEQFLAHATDSRLSESVTFSWFKDPPLTITVTEAGRDRFLPAI